MYKFPIYWTEKLKIDFLQRIILIHSYLYYELDASVWSDKKYDEVAKQLTNIQNKYKQTEGVDALKSKTQYGYAMHDFDGTTGFDLWSRLNKQDKRFISNIAGRIRR